MSTCGAKLTTHSLSTSMLASRRGFITGLGALFVAAPAIVRASSLDMVRGAIMQMETRTRAIHMMPGDYGWETFQVLMDNPAASPCDLFEDPEDVIPRQVFIAGRVQNPRKIWGRDEADKEVMKWLQF